MEIGFSAEKYIEEQSKHIKERINRDNSERLYLEFGGKLVQDKHAARVLPGFDENAKVKLLQRLKDEAEIIICIYSGDITTNKTRHDFGITYDLEVLRLIDIFRTYNLKINSVVVTRYEDAPAVNMFINNLQRRGIRTYKHYFTKGYPTDVETIVSDEGYGANPYIEVTKPLIVVTGPGGGSGKLATCLSQLYHDYKRGLKARYAKFETFPVWNLPLKHPVNVAYEAATADLGDNNIIDPYHLEAHGEVTVNYNRDVEAFPVLKAMMEKIAGTSPYQSPTDMGVNMVGNCIIDDEVCQEASKAEIVRRWFRAAEKLERTGMGERELTKINLLMKDVNVDQNFSPAHAACLHKAEETGKLAGAMVMPDGTIITGKTSELLGAPASLLLNALKYVVGIEKKTFIVSNEVLRPICALKESNFKLARTSLCADEMLIALSISSITNPLAGKAVDATQLLRGCDAYFSSIIPSDDESIYHKLGINVCCEPIFEQGQFFHQ